MNNFIVRPFFQDFIGNGADRQLGRNIFSNLARQNGRNVDAPNDVQRVMRNIQGRDQDIENVNDYE